MRGAGSDTENRIQLFIKPRSDRISLHFSLAGQFVSHAYGLARDVYREGRVE